MKWVKASFELPPGQHRITIWLKKFLTLSPKARAEIVLQERDVANVEFTGPVTIFAAGKINYKVEAASVSRNHPINDQVPVCLGCGKRLPVGEGRFCPFCRGQTPQKFSVRSAEEVKVEATLRFLRCSL
jgi:hypothetical protein